MEVEPSPNLSCNPRNQSKELQLDVDSRHTNVSGMIIKHNNQLLISGLLSACKYSNRLNSTLS
jgi:hypothetical protein